MDCYSYMQKNQKNGSFSYKMLEYNTFLFKSTDYGEYGPGDYFSQVSLNIFTVWTFVNILTFCVYCPPAKSCLLDNFSYIFTSSVPQPCLLTETLLYITKNWLRLERRRNASAEIKLILLVIDISHISKVCKQPYWYFHQLGLLATKMTYRSSKKSEGRSIGGNIKK